MLKNSPMDSFQVYRLVLMNGVKDFQDEKIKFKDMNIGKIFIRNRACLDIIFLLVYLQIDLYIIRSRLMQIVSLLTDRYFSFPRNSWRLPKSILNLWWIWKISDLQVTIWNSSVLLKGEEWTLTWCCELSFTKPHNQKKQFSSSVIVWDVLPTWWCSRFLKIEFEDWTPPHSG